LITKQEIRRSFDFERIYNSFLANYPTREEAETLYYDWLKVMKLDETRPYCQARESYAWTRDNIQFIKENNTHKFYEVEVGFPTTSMNHNTYKKRDLVAASTRLKGKHPSLNHKSQFWFSPKNPQNRWGNIPIVDGRFHEGISKALVAVPKDMICPVCEGDKRMVDLIDEKKIVNVSLEGECAGEHCIDGSCEGFYYTDPPFTFLTTDVLPGIPMTRIKPIESYTGIPSQSTISRGTTKKVKLELKNKKKQESKTLKIKLVPKQKKEARDPDDMGHYKPAKIGRDTYADPNIHYPDAVADQSGGASFRGNLQKVSQQTNVAVGKDPASKKPEGVWQTEITSAETTDRQPNEEVEETIPHGTFGTGYGPLNLPKKATPKLIGTDPPMPSVDSHRGPDKAGKVNPDLTTSSLPAGGSKRAKPPLGPDTHPGEPSGITGVWRDGTKTRPDSIGVYSSKPTPHEATSEKVARIKAELKAEGLSKNLEYVTSVWESKFASLNDKHLQLQSEYGKQEALLSEVRSNKKQLEEKLDSLRESLGKEVQDAKVELLDYKGRYGGTVRENTKLNTLVEDLKLQNTELNAKYTQSLANNLKLTRDSTKANEDYLELAKENERLKEALKKAKINSKKTLKIKI